MNGPKMTEPRKALGRGLEALLPSSRSSVAVATTAASDENGAREISVAMIDRNPYQTRGHVDEVAMAELMASIQASGVIQPIVVRPVGGGRYQIMAGERRWLASQKAGKATIPAVVRPASDEQAMEITIVENLQREDLNPIEQARAYERLSREFGLTQEQMASRTGKDRASVANFLRLLKLPKEVQQAIAEGKLSFGHGKVLMMLSSESSDVVLKMAQRIIENAMSVRQAEELIHKMIAGADRSGEPSVVKPKDPNVRQAEFELQRTLGCRVNIRDRGGKGKIVIEYASLEDFDRILEVAGSGK